MPFTTVLRGCIMFVMATPAPNQKRKRRGYQFTLALLGVFAAIIFAGLGWLVQERSKVRKHLAAFEAVDKLGRAIEVIESPPIRPAWLRGLLGENRTEELVGVFLNNRPRVTDDALAHFTCHAKLKMLRLNETRVSDAGLAHLAGLANLNELELNNTGVTDAGLLHLAGMTELETLSLYNTQVTDAGLIYLAGLTNLRTLSLDNTQITDAGLIHFSGMTKLERLWLNNTQVTDAGIAELKMVLPSVQVVR